MMTTKESFDLQSWHSTVLARLARAYHASTNGFERFTGMASTRWRLLFLVHSKGVCTQKDLTQQIGVDPGSITRQIKLLDQDGLVARSAHPQDNRLTEVRLTAKGLATVERVRAQRAVFLQEMMKGCSAKEIDAFLVVLDRIAINLDHPDILKVLDR
ncbi:MAG: MarR family winged helix-turn-helix transcriptional regulator [Achromobacter sp.]|uniref:MarR family winged helix-turn-helix transcriptional regulator n=1 Tax=Achromobacter sp. TaxID=134375 RepID=UPI003D018B81